MYKIMIVDDEAEVREAIVKKMDWNSLGFEVSADAENGLDALEKAETLDLDVILTDIKMPFMDGLELGKALQERRSPIKLIVFSGFDDFEFAKEAIKLNVMEYVLKPVNAEELSRVLLKVKGILDEERSSKRSIEALKKNYEEMLPVIRERFLTDLVRGVHGELDVESQLRELDIPVTEKPCHLMAVGRIGHGQQGERKTNFDREMLRLSVSSLLDEQLGEEFGHAIWVDRTYLMLLISIDRETQTEELIEALEGVCKSCRKIFGVSLTIGLGKSGKGYETIPVSYAEALQALEYRAILGSERVIYHGDVDYSVPVSTRFDSEEAAYLTKAITFAMGDEETLQEAVDRILDKVEESDTLVQDYQIYMLGLMDTLMRMIEKYGLPMEEMLGHGGNYLDILSSFGTSVQLSDWLLSTCLKISRGIEEKRAATTRNIIDEAKDYIEQNYADSELSVDKLCHQIHISPSYFSTIFKQETGRSYVSYLTDIRLEKAAELLKSTEDKTYLIAARVGYQEPNYFSYVFKKKYGVSPSKFRNG